MKSDCILGFFFGKGSDRGRQPIPGQDVLAALPMKHPKAADTSPFFIPPWRQSVNLGLDGSPNPGAPLAHFKCPDAAGH